MNQSNESITSFKESFAKGVKSISNFLTEQLDNTEEIISSFKESFSKGINRISHFFQNDLENSKNNILSNIQNIRSDSIYENKTSNNLKI